MTSSIKPTIGRKVWYYGTNINACKDVKDPFDATVIYVPDAENVVLKITDHYGNDSVETVPILDPSTDEDKPDMHGMKAFATWMPYQVGQAKAAETSTTDPSPAA